jgi:hypothetical protein
MLVKVAHKQTFQSSQELLAVGHKEYPGTTSGKQEETPSPKEAGSVCACGRSSSFAEPGWVECTCAQVWPRHQAATLFPELFVKGARSA